MKLWSIVMIVTVSCIIAVAGPDRNNQTIHDLKDDDLLVLKGWAYWEDNHPTLRQYLNEMAFEQLDMRESRILKLKGAKNWRKQIARARSRYMEVMGDMPERTPLNPRVTGIDETEFCRIERIIFESRPEMYVTSCLLIPKEIEGPRPAVLYVCGHSADGYRSDAYQHVIFNLAKKGFVVLAMDPVGQGERLMYYDEERQKSRFGPTGEHSYVGKQTFLNGVSLGAYFIWDMVRALDYLETRPEVDPTRIAVQGRSGGGTQSSYLMAFDERVAVGAPECYITSLRRLLQSAGPQDAEQCFFRGLTLGLDHPDFLEIRAPKPTMIITTTNDFFSIAGARETVAEARRAYSALGAEENLVMVEDDAPHASTAKNREAFCVFLRRHFAFPGPVQDELIDPLAPERLNCTQTGQVITSLGGKTVFDYNREYGLKLIEELEKKRSALNAYKTTVRLQAQRLSGYEDPAPVDTPPTLVNRILLNGYVLEKWIIPGDRGLIIPALVAVPHAAKEGAEPHAITLLFLSEGKFSNRSLIEKLAQSGHFVLSADLAGIGETASGNREYQDPYLALWLGTSIVGIRATQISRCVDFVTERYCGDAGNITAVGSGAAASAVLHAAVYDNRIARVALVDGLASYERVIMNRDHEFDSSNLIGAVLTEYDLPDLIGLLAPREAIVAGARDHMGRVLSADECESDLHFARNCYKSDSAEGSLAIV
ncbi:MAG: acetylxylan esterase, partial [bacterium]